MNKILWIILITIGMLLLGITLEPDFTGLVIYDAVIKDADTITVADLSFTVQFQDDKVRLISNNGEILLYENKTDVFENKLYALKNVNVEQKTAQLMVNNYDLNVQINRAIDAEELQLGEQVNVRSIITNNEPEEITLEFHQYNSLAYEIQPLVKVASKQASFIQGKESEYVLITIPPHEKTTVDYALKLINPDVKTTDIPKASIIKDLGGAAFEIESPAISMKIKPILSFDLNIPQNLPISKEHKISLTLANNGNEPLSINQLEINLPSSVNIKPITSGLQQQGSKLTWAGTISKAQTLEFTIASNKIETATLMLTIKYVVNNIPVATYHEEKIPFIVNPLLPLIILTSETVSGGETLTITPQFTNDDLTIFKELEGSVKLFTETVPIKIQELTGKEIILDPIAKVTPFSDNDYHEQVIFEGTYKTLDNTMINFSEQKIVTIKKAEFVPAFDFLLIPIGYKKGVIQLLALATKKNEGITNVKIIHDTKKSDLISTFEAISLKMGVVFEIPTQEANERQKTITQEARLMYTIGEQNHIINTQFSGELKKIAKDIKLSKERYNVNEISLIDYSSGTTPSKLTSGSELVIYQTAGISFNLVYFFIILAVGIILGAGLYIYHKKQVERNKVSVDTSFVPRKDQLSVYDAPTPDKGLIEGQKFVEYCRAAHISDEKIKIKLREKGWLGDFINEFFK